MPTRTIAFALAALVASLGTAALPQCAQAQIFQQEHPRRAEVLGRLKSENARIDAGRAQGELSKGQAQRLHNEDRAIHAEERADKTLNGGHITRAEQGQLNRQENQLSRQLHRGRAL